MSIPVTPEFSADTRKLALERFRAETFDFLVVGGGITGAAVARDAARRGLSVALVERKDFAWGTSSRSSKLIHGGLRYLENLEFTLVFEALSERALLLKTAPHLVRPLRFYLPIYQGNPHSRMKIGAGLWLYDLLSLFRAPGFHRSLSRDQLLRELPGLEERKLSGGFSYFDASMWDDAMVTEILRSASASGAAVANYVEAREAFFEGDRLAGFACKDELTGSEFRIKAHQTVVCAGPWTDLVGGKTGPGWQHWLKPSKGVHLVFPYAKLPLPGAVTMTHSDGRIVFVIPRTDYGEGVTIVGTTDGPTPDDPDRASVEDSDTAYLLNVLSRFFPGCKLGAQDVVSNYVGVRPLVDFGAQGSLAKASREHRIGEGPGGTVIAAGGKYTTHRTMAEEIVETALHRWKASQDRPAHWERLQKPRTKEPFTPAALTPAKAEAMAIAKEKGLRLPATLLGRYGSDALGIVESAEKDGEDAARSGLLGFPYLRAVYEFERRHGMALGPRDFLERRVPVALTLGEDAVEKGIQYLGG